jgi:hypothetical protein
MCDLDKAPRAPSALSDFGKALDNLTSQPRNHPTLNHIRLERNMETLLDEAQ